MNILDPSIPFDRSYWVLPGKLLAGCYPGSSDAARAERRLQALLDHKVGLVVNLMEPGEPNRQGRPFVPYGEAIQALAEKRGVTVAFQRHPVADLDAPARMDMWRILDGIDEGTKNGRAVYVHGRAGIGRTGTVVGCWIARHGIASRFDVLRMIGSLRQRTPDYFVPSPETERQVRMVLSWNEGE